MNKATHPVALSGTKVVSDQRWRYSPVSGLANADQHARKEKEAETCAATGVASGSNKNGQETEFGGKACKR